MVGVYSCFALYPFKSWFFGRVTLKSIGLSSKSPPVCQPWPFLPFLLHSDFNAHLLNLLVRVQKIKHQVLGEGGKKFHTFDRQSGVWEFVAL